MHNTTAHPHPCSDVECLCAHLCQVVSLPHPPPLTGVKANTPTLTLQQTGHLNRGREGGREGGAEEEEEEGDRRKGVREEGNRGEGGCKEGMGRERVRDNMHTNQTTIMPSRLTANEG